MGALDRALTIVITATLTSAVWFLAGGTIVDRLRGGHAGWSLVGARAVPARPAARPAPEASAPGAVAVRSGSLVIPVAGTTSGELVDTFNAPRGGGTRTHEALDILAPEGTPVLAAAPGRVEKLFWSDAGGKTIYVRSADGRTIYYYAHLVDYAPGLAENQIVTAGQRLGGVGVTGNADPAVPHLHFQILRTTPAAKWWADATPVNPYPLLTKR
ncbi:peptidoglycan DD-metalloendopeptidase family protein [Altererythrobacter aerius]|uniref:Peptidoglycan DD-metalloendopeptidase family protein n=1 Tax=Tsuneonella aeria TaxID=1837929 RepID=A0A6I4TCT2_9SPHN|nr:M23 family metallopeptidase [Tsuneonella aeria]MXO73960.1 peptidoglycan DD-metalloendopeptidase family protein [Tsuneonella aeria]